MKCPKCKYVSFDGLTRCKKCGFVFAKDDTHQDAEDIKSIIAEMRSKGIEKTRKDEQPPAFDKTVASIRESLDAIEGDTSGDGWLAEQEKTTQIDTDNLRLRMDENFIENKKRFPDHAEINWEESISLANGELDLSIAGGEGQGEEETGAMNDAAVPFAQTEHFKEELQKIKGDLEEIDQMPVASAPLASNGATSHLDMLSVKKGGFWIRYAAWLIDTIVLNIIGFILLRIGSLALDLGSSDFQNLEIEEMAVIMIPYFLFMIIVHSAYFTYFHASTGKTPGKMICKLKVVCLNGEPVGYSRAFLRWIGYLVSSILYLGFLWVAFDRRKQGWHDKIAGTYVVRN